MTVILAHGIRQFKAKSQMQPLADALADRGIETHFADYGYVFIPTSNNKAERAVANATRNDDDIAAFSNGAWGAVEAIEKNKIRVNNLYLISPALNVDTDFPESINRIFIFYTPSDNVTPLAKMWRRFVGIFPWRWRNPHGWGEMGTKGPRKFDPRQTKLELPCNPKHAWNKNTQAIAFIANKIEENTK